MSRLSVPPSPRPLATSSERESTPKLKARSPSPVIERGPVNGKAIDKNASITTRLLSPPPSSRAQSLAPEEPEESEDKASQSEDSSVVIDIETFDQILELDEDDGREFSLEMVQEYFIQAATTFDEMDKALTEKDCASLSSLGHFLKGSSAALGVSKVKSSCEKIQHYGKLRDEDAGKDLDEETALEMIEALLVNVKKEYAEAERWLRDWYEKEGLSLD